MDATTERSFRTKTGACVVHDDRLVLERSGKRGALANLPGVLEGGAAEYERALELLRREGLPVS